MALDTSGWFVDIHLILAGFRFRLSTEGGFR
jgi:hypothetical protein